MCVTGRSATARAQPDGAVAARATRHRTASRWMIGRGPGLHMRRSGYQLVVIDPESCLLAVGSRHHEHAPTKIGRIGYNKSVSRDGGLVKKEKGGARGIMQH